MELLKQPDILDLMEQKPWDRQTQIPGVEVTKRHVVKLCNNYQVTDVMKKLLPKIESYVSKTPIYEWFVFSIKIGF